MLDAGFKMTAFFSFHNPYMNFYVEVLPEYIFG